MHACVFVTGTHTLSFPLTEKTSASFHFTLYDNTFCTLSSAYLFLFKEQGITVSSRVTEEW